MEDRMICLVLLGAILIGTCHGAMLSTITDEVYAKKFLDKVTGQLYNSYEQHYAYAVHGRENTLKQFNKVLSIAKAVGIINETKAYDYSQFKDKGLDDNFHTISKSGHEAVLLDEVQMFETVTLLEELAIDKDLSYFPEIHNIIAKCNDSEELKYYWSTWRDKNDGWAKAHFDFIVNILRKAVNLTDMTPYGFWMREYNITEMEKVMTQIEPLYKQLHAFIRKKYGEQEINPNGPIPDHLFQQVLAQAWTDGSVIDEMYLHKDLPPYDSILEKNNYDTFKLYKTADKFYQSLGFEPIPDSLWDTQIRMNKDEDEGDCKATVFDFTSNVYMQYCHKMDFRKFLQAHGYMGRMYYAREKKHLPAYYFPSHDLEYPIGNAVILSASTSKHLKAIGMESDFEFTDEELMNYE